MEGGRAPSHPRPDHHQHGGHSIRAGSSSAVPLSGERPPATHGRRADTFTPSAGSPPPAATVPALGHDGRRAPSRASHPHHMQTVGADPATLPASYVCGCARVCGCVCAYMRGWGCGGIYPWARTPSGTHARPQCGGRSRICLWYVYFHRDGFLPKITSLNQRFRCSWAKILGSTFTNGMGKKWGFMN